MGLFGNGGEQDARLEELERRMRRVSEHVAHLSADLSQTRMELLKTRARGFRWGSATVGVFEPEVTR